MTADRWVGAVAAILAGLLILTLLGAWWLDRDRTAITNRDIDMHSHDRAEIVRDPEEGQ